MADYIVELLASFCAVVIVLTLHEFAHALVAYKCGDPTPKWEGRLSLNPLRHYDLWGLLCFTFVGFGWAKPVSVNAYNFRNYRAGLILTACAGVIANFILAFLIYPLYLVVAYYVPHIPFVTLLLRDFFYFVFAYSLSFFVFNLLPLYPLDGFRILDAADRRNGRVTRFLRSNGQYILFALIAESFLCKLLVRFGISQMAWFDILGWFMQFATELLGWPIKALWGLIPW